MNTNHGGNLAQWQAAHGLRSSSAAQPHKNQRREARKGYGKGGRSGAKAGLRRAY